MPYRNETNSYSALFIVYFKYFAIACRERQITSLLSFRTPLSTPR